MRHGPAPLLSNHCRIRRDVLGACATVLLLGGTTGVLRAQDVAGSPAAQSGLRISTISLYGAYYSSGIPNSLALIQAGAANLTYDAGAGGSIRFDWTKFSGRSTFALTYTPSYIYDAHYSSLNALNHSLSLNLSRKLAPRWQFGFALEGNLATQAEAEFARTTLSTVASTPATFNELASALLSSQYANNPQLGVVLTNSPLLESPLGNLIYGERVLTASAQISLSYSFSPRLFITLTGTANRMQHVSQNHASTVNSYLIPTTTSAGAGVELSYSLSPVTQIGGSVNTARIVSGLFDAYTTTSRLKWGRTLNQHWLMKLHGGIGITNIVNYGALAIGSTGMITYPIGPQPVFGASLAYKMSAHTFLGSFDRSPLDSYGLGASTTSTSTATWSWRPPGIPWWLETAFSWQQMTGSTVENISGWRTTVGLNRALGAHVVLLTQYIYQDSSGGFKTDTYHFAESTARVALTWVPHPAALR